MHFSSDFFPFKFIVGSVGDFGLFPARFSRDRSSRSLIFQHNYYDIIPSNIFLDDL